MPRPIIYVLLVLVAASLVPMGMIFKASNSPKTQPRIQIIYDMDDQSYAKSQTESNFFADGQAMRKHPEGTVAQGHLQAEEPIYAGRVSVSDTSFVQTFPVPVTREMVYRGRERYNISCAPCHGTSGNGAGTVHVRAMQLAEGTWTPPTDLTGATIVAQPVGQIYDTIKHGVRAMPGYAVQVTPEDRWAIVAYVRALQMSRNANIDDIPAASRASLNK
ncbi:MAG: mono/diheme cytochrome c family protein [Candidatus Krumholzibacteriia bacterium]|jgi:mono/diheme cytochrome c family protein